MLEWFTNGWYWLQSSWGNHLVQFATNLTYMTRTTELSHPSSNLAKKKCYRAQTSYTLQLMFHFFFSCIFRNILLTQKSLSTQAGNTEIGLTAAGTKTCTSPGGVSIPSALGNTFSPARSLPRIMATPCAGNFGRNPICSESLQSCKNSNSVSNIRECVAPVSRRTLIGTCSVLLSAETAA